MLSVALRILLLCPLLLVPSVQAQVAHIPSISARDTSYGLRPQKNITEYTHTVLQTEIGLPQNSIMAMCQTHDGYLWVGTQEGLVRFDGARCTVFDKDNTPSFKHNVVEALRETRDGSLWIGTRGGLVRLHHGVFRLYSTSDGMANDHVLSLMEDRAGRLWIGTRGGLLCYDNGRFTTLTTQQGLGSNTVRSLALDSAGTLLIGTWSGVCKLESNLTLTQGTQTTPLILQPLLPASYTNSLHTPWKVHNILVARSGEYWFATEEQGVFCLKSGVITPYTVANGLAGNIVYTLLQDRIGTIWFGTREGLSRLTKDGISTYTTQNGLSNNIVRSLCEDREGVLWCGTFYGGLNRFNDGRFVVYGRNEGLSGNVSRCVLQDSEGAMWVGTLGGGVTRHKDGKLRVFTEEDGLPSNTIWTFCNDRTGGIWVGAYLGVAHWSGKRDHERWQSYTAKNGLAGNQFRAIFQDQRGSLWVGSYEDALRRLQGRTFVDYTARYGLPNNVSVYAVAEHPQGGIMFGTSGAGLYHVRNDSLIHHYTKSDGLGSDFVWALTFDREGTLWIGTSGGGLSRLKQGRITTWAKNEGLFDNAVFCVLEDERGYFWMSCNKGIMRVKKSEFEEVAMGRLKRVNCQVFGTADGLRSAECSSGQTCATKSRDGRLWFTTIQGVAVVDPNNLAFNSLPPPVIIEEVFADSIRLPLNDSTKLPPTIAKMEIYYTATSLLVPEKVRFKYMLEGFDNTWVDAGNRRVAYYTSLPRGRQYRFRVIACNNDGVWNEHGALYGFYLRPFWYETWWFYGIGVVSMIVGGIGVYQWRVRAIDARNRALEREVSERTHELSEANAEIQRQMDIQTEQSREIAIANTELQDKNSQLSLLNAEKDEFMGIATHDLKNPLNAIQGMADMILMYGDEMNEAQKQQFLTSIVNSSEQMFDLIKNLLDVNAIESGGLSLQPVRFDLSEQAELVADSYRVRAEQKQIKIHFTSDGAAYVSADEVAMKQVLDNLVSNAVKYSPHGKNVWVVVKEQRARSNEYDSKLEPVPCCFVLVKDEGPGFSPDDKKNLFGKFARLSARPTSGEHSTGLGLSIVKKLVEAMGGRVWCESELGAGATFVVELPSVERL